jgi:acyl-CoA synthetase (AMP-forming)/AMP-acid ligase II
VEHGAIAFYLDWFISDRRLSAGDTSLLHTPIDVDLTLTSLFGPLLVGGRIRIIDQGLEALVQALEAEGGLAFLKLTPSHLALLGAMLSDRAIAGASRALIVGGEALRAEALARWRRLAPDTVIVNEYGPTEATVACCAYTLDPADPATGPVPIGRPIPGVRLAVCDPQGRPVPEGAIGELHIAGPGLARGYIGRPQETAAAFVHHQDPSGPWRAYKSGDRVFCDEAGDLVYLDRADRQVKIGGHRIELGEVEAALCRLPGVRQAAALVDEGRLLAVVAGTPAAGRRARLGAELPAPMLPDRLVELPGLPLSAGGKIDRQALLRALARPPVATVGDPRQLAPTIAAVWSELLDRPVSDHDTSFFDLGGHSLLLIEAAAELGRRLGREVPLLTLFRAPTVRALAEALATTDVTGGDGAMAAAEERSRQRQARRVARRRG